jgi:hypothetical protein
MVQPFMPEVQTLAEWSLIFLGRGVQSLGP